MVLNRTQTVLHENGASSIFAAHLWCHGLLFFRRYKRPSIAPLMAKFRCSTWPTVSAQMFAVFIAKIMAIRCGVDSVLACKLLFISG